MPRKNKLTYNRAIQVPRRRQKQAPIHITSPVDTAKTQNNFLGILTKVFFILGFVLLGIYLALRINQEVQLSYFAPKGVPAVQQTQKTSAIPTQIVISKVSIDLPIEQTAINDGVWQIGQNGASHLAISARPGEQSTSIMYGHNTNDRFGPIRWLTKGDRIDVLTTDGKKHTYTIAETMKVKPDKMDIFTKYKGEVLILYTCDGFADLERFVVIARPK